MYVGIAGYASATDTITVTSGTARISFHLGESAIRLREVVVSASPSARTSDEQYQSTASKSLVEFQTSPGTTFAEKISDPQATDPNFQTLNASRLSNAVTASLGAIQVLTAHLTGSLSVARSFRAPTVQELFANGLDAPSGTYTIGTPGLEPEAGLCADLSLKGGFSNASFEISPYANSIQHYIYGFLRGDTIQGFPVRQFSETNARLLGFEASVTVQPAQYIALKAATDYVNAEDSRQNVPLPFTPPLRGLLRATFQDRTYMALIETRVAASQARLGAGDTPTAGYAVVNVGVGMRFARQRVLSNISIHCDNVFNRIYRDNLSVIKDFIPQPTRGFRLNYEATY